MKAIVSLLLVALVAASLTLAATPAPASPAPQLGVLVPIVQEAIGLVRAILDDRVSQREFDAQVIAALDPNDPEDKALLRRYVTSIIAREEITTANLQWWQDNVFSKLGELLDGELIDAIGEALKTAG